MASSARSTALRDRDREHATTTLLDRLREQFPELALADLADAVDGALPLPDPATAPADAPARPAAPRYRA